MIELVQMAFRLYTFLVLARVILSWVSHNPSNPIIAWIYRVTDPVLEPIRQLLPSLGGIDFSPILVLFLLRMVENLVVGLLVNLSMA